MFLISPDLGRILTTEVFSLGADQLRDHGGFRTDDAGHGRQSRLNGDRFIELDVVDVVVRRPCHVFPDRDLRRGRSSQYRVLQRDRSSSRLESRPSHVKRSAVRDEFFVTRISLAPCSRRIRTLSSSTEQARGTAAGSVASRPMIASARHADDSTTESRIECRFVSRKYRSCPTQSLMKTRE